MLEKQGRDEGLREKYGLHDDVDLGEEDVEGGRARWEAGRERRGLPVEETDTAEGSTAGARGTPSMSSQRNGKGRAGDPSMSTSTPSLAQVLRKTTKRKFDPFADAADTFLSSPSLFAVTPNSRGRIKDPEGIGSTPAKLVVKEKASITPVAVAVGLLAGYASD